VQVVAARRRGQRVVGEATAAGLSLDESIMWHSNFTVAAAHVMSPPLRSERDRIALRGGVAGGMLQIVGTDHAVFNSSQKAMGAHDFRKIPNGVNGIEERLHVVWETMVSFSVASACLCLLWDTGWAAL
jgi:dihydropyrimidinase